jgi:hypothetical protein
MMVVMTWIFAGVTPGFVSVLIAVVAVDVFVLLHVNVVVGFAGVVFPPLPVINVVQLPLYVYVDFVDAPVTPPPVQPVSFPIVVTFEFTLVLLPRMGRPGLPVCVALNALHVVPATAPAGLADKTPTGTRNEIAKSKPRPLRMQTPLEWTPCP